MFRTRLTRRGKKLFAIRDKKGRFKNIESISRSLRRDRATKAKRKVRSGQGFRGDR
jgi:hypothetical protein